MHTCRDLWWLFCCLPNLYNNVYITLKFCDSGQVNTSFEAGGLVASSLAGPQNEVSLV